MFRTFAHTADAGLWVEADDLNSLFADAGLALCSLFVSDLKTVERRIRNEIAVAGEELDFLMLDWLSELLYLFESQHLLFCDFQVSLTDNGLTAVAMGEPVDSLRHHLEHEVKAITYHDLNVEQADGKWTAQVIVDI